MSTVKKPGAHSTASLLPSVYSSWSFEVESAIQLVDEGEPS
jgi:hypothetical protein